MKLAGTHRTTPAAPAPTPLYEFTVERKALPWDITNYARDGYTNARNDQQRAAVADMTATVIASTTTDALEEFTRATGEYPRQWPTTHQWRDNDIRDVASIRVRVAGMRQVTL